MSKTLFYDGNVEWRVPMCLSLPSINRKRSSSIADDSNQSENVPTKKPKNADSLVISHENSSSEPEKDDHSESNDSNLMSSTNDDAIETFEYVDIEFKEPPAETVSHTDDIDTELDSDVLGTNDDVRADVQNGMFGYLFIDFSRKGPQVCFRNRAFLTLNLPLIRSMINNLINANVCVTLLYLEDGVLRWSNKKKRTQRVLECFHRLQIGSLGKNMRAVEVKHVCSLLISAHE